MCNSKGQSMDECPVICKPVDPTDDIYNNCKYLQKPCNHQIVNENVYEEKVAYPYSKVEVNLCAGCNESIHDRFMLQTVEKKWHIGCLICCVCNRALDEPGSCFSKDEKIYCKSDYSRIFGTRKCSKCDKTIMKSELVMRARQLVFHLSCFACDICNAPLTRGDYYVIKDSSVYCRIHFNETLDQPGGSYIHMPSIHGKTDHVLTNDELIQDEEGKLFSKFYGPEDGSPQKGRQKGRPRKRKQKEYEVNNLEMNNEFLELGFSRDCLNNSSRAKRMRTSFKHHQLRAMKSYFQLNHNPDAKDLKQLSQKTGLPKRVLQVWFQNARAKYRRLVSKQEHNKVFDTDEYDTFTSPIRMINDCTSSSSVE